MKYEIKGGTLPVVVCSLDAGESIVSEAGAMSWHTVSIKVETKGRGGKNVWKSFFRIINVPKYL